MSRTITRTFTGADNRLESLESIATLASEEIILLFYPGIPFGIGNYITSFKIQNRGPAESGAGSDEQLIDISGMNNRGESRTAKFSNGMLLLDESTFVQETHRISSETATALKPWAKELLQFLLSHQLPYFQNESLAESLQTIEANRMLTYMRDGHPINSHAITSEPPAFLSEIRWVGKTETPITVNFRHNEFVFNYNLENPLNLFAALLEAINRLVFDKLMITNLALLSMAHDGAFIDIGSWDKKYPKAGDTLYVTADRIGVSTPQKEYELPLKMICNVMIRLLTGVAPGCASTSITELVNQEVAAQQQQIASRRDLLAAADGVGPARSWSARIPIKAPTETIAAPSLAAQPAATIQGPAPVPFILSLLFFWPKVRKPATTELSLPLRNSVINTLTALRTEYERINHRGRPIAKLDELIHGICLLNSLNDLATAIEESRPCKHFVRECYDIPFSRTLMELADQVRKNPQRISPEDILIFYRANVESLRSGVGIK